VGAGFVGCEGDEGRNCGWGTTNKEAGVRLSRAFGPLLAALILGTAVLFAPSPATAAPPPGNPYANYPDRVVRYDPKNPPPDVSILASGLTAGLMADPDTIVPQTGTQYYTYGTTTRGWGQCGGRQDNRTIWVPYIASGSGDTVDLADQCITDDAMPSGPGAWADPDGGVWAPSVVYWGGRYIMYYTATKAGTGQKCIGKAGSSSPAGPFSDGGIVVCPQGGRWAIDPDAFGHNGALYLTYRDDGTTSGAETGISVMRLDASGAADLSTRHTALRSTDITWESAGGATNHIIENPSMMFVGGHWMLFYSGNNWDQARYSTGIALCPDPLATTGCTPYASTTNPYFGYTGGGNIGPLYGLPFSMPGPGGMSLFRNRAGDARVVWAGHASTTSLFRRAAVGVLSFNGLVWEVT
jgi:hypothetical protein